MSKKVANASKQPVAIRLVKRASASVGFSDGIKPAGAIDDGVELSFNLGPYTPDQGRFVIGSSTTPNIKNPQTYVDIGEEFKISEIDGNVFIEGDLTTNETDPNYTTLTFGVFFRLKKTDGLYVMASERPTHTVVNYKNVKTQVEKVAIKQSVGQYFNDDNYYIPLYLGTVKELLAHWADTTAMGLPELKALGHRVIGNKVSLTVDLPLESVTITNTGDFVIGETVEITHQRTPAIAKIVNTEYSVDDPTIAEFNPGTNQLVIKSMGAVNVTVTLTDNIGNVMSTSKTFNTILDYAPLIAKYDVNNSAVHLDITPTATTKGFVDWGDGTVEALSDNVTHQYIGASKPTVKLWVDGGLDVANIAADNTLVEVVQWGDKVIKHPQVGSSKLVKVPTVAPLGLTSTVSTFEGATLFNQNLNGWDMSGVTSVEGMFAGASSFNGLVDTWNVSKVKRFARMFDGAASFNSSVNAWNVSAGESFANMFTNASTFNQPIDQWRPTGKGQVSASLMFSGAVSFNSSVAGFFTSAVNNCTEMFAGCSSFNQDLAGVKLSTPLIADGMFKDCIAFNKPVGNLNGVDLIGVVGMFEGCRSFNQNLMGLKFKTSNLNSLLAGCSTFNQPLNDLDVSNVTSMDYLFDGCTAFTSDLSAWDVSSLKSATAMLRNTSNFDSDLNWWCVSNITTEPENFATGSFLASSNHPLWGTCPVRDVVIEIDNKNQFLMLGDNGVMTYTANKPFDEVSVVWLSSNPDAISINAATGEYAVVGLGGASISVKVNDLYSARRNYLTIQEYNPATFKANGDSVTIQLVANSSRAGEAYVDWGDGVYEQVTAVNPLTHTYKDTTERLISVMPMSPLGSSIDVNGPAITSIEQFGECDVTITSRDLVAVPTTLPTTLTKVAFVNCPNLNDPNIANWDVTNITNFSHMFAGCSSFNQDISGWDVADATNLAFMFENATVFNQDISDWGVGNVVNMEGMFFGAAAFNQPIGDWNVSSVISMDKMFKGTSFDQPLTGWVTTSLKHIHEMFRDSAFNQPLNHFIVDNVQDMSYAFAGTSKFNQPLDLWNPVGADKSSLYNRGLTGMFADNAVFNQNLTSWCVSKDTVEPVDWNINGVMDVANYPVWGTCPVRDYTLTITPIEELMVGKTEQLNYTSVPEELNVRTVAWTSDNPEIATVDDAGVVTAVGVGEATINLVINRFYTSTLTVTTVDEQSIAPATNFKVVVS